MARFNATKNSSDGMAVLAALRAAGSIGLDRYDIMAALGYTTFDLHHFNLVMAWARRHAAGVGWVIPRPHGKIDAALGGQSWNYRLTNELGQVDGLDGARAGILVALNDTLTRQHTQTSTLDVLKSSRALSTPIRNRLRRAHMASQGQEVYLENLIDMIELVP